MSTEFTHRQRIVIVSDGEAPEEKGIYLGKDVAEVDAHIVLVDERYRGEQDNGLRNIWGRWLRADPETATDDVRTPPVAGT